MEKKNSFVLVLPAMALVCALAGCASFESIKITNPPSRTVYGQGEKFDQSGMEVGGVTKKGEVKPVTNSRIQINGYDRNKPGIQTVAVVYKKVQTVLEVEVVPVLSISIVKSPSLVKQYEDITGLSVRADYGDRVPAATVAAAALALSGYDKNATGKQAVTADYYGKTAGFEVTVVEMSRLLITKPPAKVIYLTGEELNLEGLNAAGSWAGIGDAPVTPKYVSGFESTTKGQKTVVVEANGKQASFTVTVKEPVDPAVWTPVTGGFVKNIAGVVYGGGKFVAAGYNDDDPNESIVEYSTDGVNWIKSSVYDFKITSIFLAGDTFFFTGFTPEGKPVIRRSADGIAKDAKQYAYYNDFAEGASRCTGIAYGDGKWVAVFNGGKAAYASDSLGREWNAISVSNADTWQGKTSIFFDSKKFIAFEASGSYRASKGTFIYSTANWDKGEGATLNGRPITGMVFGGGKWIGIGPNNAIGWSTDGITWTTADNIGNNDDKLRRGNFTGAAYGADRFVAVNDQGSIIYSRDGFNWTVVFSSTFGSTGIRSVAYGDGKFVAVGDNGRIAYSRVVE